VKLLIGSAAASYRRRPEFGVELSSPFFYGVVLMSFFHFGASATLALGLFVASGLPAAALSAKDCNAQYDAKKAAGALGGMNYSAFRRTQCDVDEGAKPQPVQAASTARQTAESAPVFPAALSSKYVAEKPGAARRHTCSDQFQANKTTNANGGLRWIQHGGGYYAQCNKRLKG
jgi:hypothetical protein